MLKKAQKYLGIQPKKYKQILKQDIMEIQNFIVNIKELFEEIDSSDFEASTNFRLNDEYSSLTGMAIIAMVDEKYNVVLTGNDLKRANTIEELFSIVKNKKII